MILIKKIIFTARHTCKHTNLRLLPKMRVCANYSKIYSNCIKTSIIYVKMNIIDILDIRVFDKRYKRIHVEIFRSEKSVKWRGHYLVSSAVKVQSCQPCSVSNLASLSPTGQTGHLRHCHSKSTALA